MLHITTERLELVELSVYNSPFIIELLNSPGWLQYIGDRNVHNTDDAIAYLVNGPFNLYQQHNFGPLLIKVRETNVAIGVCGLFQRDYLDYPDLGFALLPAYEGMGYGKEASLGVLHAAAKRGITTIGAILSRDNDRSLGLLTRLGFLDKGTVTPPGSDERLLLMEAHL